MVYTNVYFKCFDKFELSYGSIQFSTPSMTTVTMANCAGMLVLLPLLVTQPIVRGLCQVLHMYIC